MIQQFLRKSRFLVVWPLFLWLFLSANTTERRLHIGIAIIVLGEWLRCVANGYVGHVKVNWTQKQRGDPKIGQLITAGPYAFVRHPLYLGTWLIGAGFCLIAGAMWLSLAALVFFLVIYRRKMAQEEALLRDEIGTPYIIYQAAMPRWLPAWTRYPNRQGQWSWRGLAASKEWKTIIWIIVTLIALYFRKEIVQEHGLFSAEDWAKHLILLMAGALLMLTDGVLELTYRWKGQSQLSRTLP